MLKTCVHSHSSPIIGDLYGDGRQEIVAVGGNSFYIIDHTGRKTTTVQIKETTLGLAASPSLVNINGQSTLFFALMAKSHGGTCAQVMVLHLPQETGRGECLADLQGEFQSVGHLAEEGHPDPGDLSNRSAGPSPSKYGGVLDVFRDGGCARPTAREPVGNRNR